MSTIMTVIATGRVPEVAQESQQTGNLAASSQELNEDSDPQRSDKGWNRPCEYDSARVR